MYVCMHVCMHVYVYVYAYAFAYAYIYMYNIYIITTLPILGCAVWVMKGYDHDNNLQKHMDLQSMRSTYE